MAGDPNRYRVVFDELDQVVADLTSCERALERLTNDLERQIAALQSQWDGLAADAQREAHLEWEQGMTAMRASLAEMRSAARVAHGNYTTAVTTNLTMWQGVQ